MSHRERRFEKHKEKHEPEPGHEHKSEPESPESGAGVCAGDSEVLQVLKRMQAQLAFLEKKLDTLLSQNTQRQASQNPFPKGKNYFRPHERRNYSGQAQTPWRDSRPWNRHDPQRHPDSQSHKFYKGHPSAPAFKKRPH